MRRPRTFRRRATGFTLIEIVIASSLMALILVSAYLCLSAAFSSQKTVEPMIEVSQNARVALGLITADLRCACVLSQDYEFLGAQRMLGDIQADNLDFATHNYTPRRAGEGDYCQESLYVDRNAETGQLSLYRRRNPLIALDPLSGGSKEEIARGVKGLRLEYFDGFDWYDTWGEQKSPNKQQTSNKTAPNLSGLPEAVRITLLLDPKPARRRGPPAMQPGETPAAQPAPETVSEEPPLVVQTVVRLEFAAALKRAASGDSSGAGDNSNPGGQGTQGTGVGGGF